MSKHIIAVMRINGFGYPQTAGLTRSFTVRIFRDADFTEFDRIRVLLPLPASVRLIIVDTCRKIPRPRINELSIPRNNDIIKTITILTLTKIEFIEHPIPLCF